METAKAQRVVSSRDERQLRKYVSKTTYDLHFPARVKVRLQLVDQNDALGLANITPFCKADHDVGCECDNRLIAIAHLVERVLLFPRPDQNATAVATHLLISLEEQ